MFITIVALILGLAMFALMIYCEFFIIKEIIKFIKGAFKKKTTTTNGDATYVNVNNTHTIKRSDNKPISDDEIPDLIKLGYQHALERERQSKNGKFHRTGKEEDASFQFAINHKDQIKEHVSPFQTCFGLARNENDLDKKIELLPFL